METRFVGHQPVATQAYEAIREELEAMRPEEVLPIRHDIMDAMTTALGVLPKVKPLRERARAKFGDAAARFIDRLEGDAQAAGKAHSLHLPTMHGPDVETLAARLSQHRTVLSLEVQVLIASDALPPGVVGELVGGTSYKGLCLDVLQLTSVLRGAWADVESKTGVTLLEIDQAEALANHVSTLLGENEQGTSSSPTADMRRRAYTRLIRTYSQVRRLVTFFHWETGDADSIAPPLGAGRRKSSADDDVEIPDVVIPDVATPVVAPVSPATPTT